MIHAGIIASSRSRGSIAHPTDLVDTWAWLEASRSADIVEATAYEIESGLGGGASVSGSSVTFETSTEIKLVVGEVVRFANLSRTTAGSPPEINGVAVTITSGDDSTSSTTWTGTLPSTDWDGMAYESLVGDKARVSPDVPQFASGGSTHNGWTESFEALSANRSPRIVQDGGEPAFEARAASGSTAGGSGRDMQLTNPGSFDADEGFTIGGIFALSAAHDINDRMMCVNAGNMTTRISFLPASLTIAMGSAAAIYTNEYDDVYRLFQFHVARSSSGVATRKTRVGDESIDTGTLTFSDTTGSVDVSRFSFLGQDGNGSRPMNNGLMRLGYAMKGDQIDNATLLAYIAAQYPDVVIP